MIEEAKHAGRNLSGHSIAFVNIYMGMQHLRTEDGGHWFICIPREYGFLTVVFHHVRHGDVVRTSLPELADSKALCVTLLWTTENRLADELLDALRTADDVIQQIEVTLGAALPLPLKRFQLPDRFAVGTIDVNQYDAAASIQTFVHLPETGYGVKINAKTAAVVGALAGAFGPSEVHFDAPLKTQLRLSANWQRRAIRAAGVEEWAEVVVSSNVWVETFVVQLAVALNEAGGTVIEDVASAVMRRGLPAFIASRLGEPFLKGSWDYKRPGTAFNKWFEHCYLLRTQVVHYGHRPSSDQAVQAYQSAHEFAYYVTDCAAKITDIRFRDLLEPLRLMSGNVK